MAIGCERVIHEQDPIESEKLKKQAAERKLKAQKTLKKIDGDNLADGGMKVVDGEIVSTIHPVMRY